LRRELLNYCYKKKKTILL